MMAKLLLDVHTHTLVSGHAYGTIREMAKAASNQELRLLGISEHAPGIPGTVHPFYYNNLEVIPRTLYGVEILHGCEINVLKNGILSLEQQYIEKLDYAIVGIHKQCYKDVGIVKNTENLIRCMQNPKVCFVSHPDDDHTPLDYEKLVQAALQYHVALEVNNSSLKKQEQRLHCRENYRKMLSFCKKYKAPIIINSDAHDPCDVGNFILAKKLVDENDFDEQLILNTDIDRFKAFIRYSKRS